MALYDTWCVHMIRLDLPGADVRYDALAWPPAKADAILATLLDEVAWEPHRLTLFGREVEAPRLSCWVGDEDAIYTYSRTRFGPKPWTTTMATLRHELEARLG